VARADDGDTRDGRHGAIGWFSPRLPAPVYRRGPRASSWPIAECVINYGRISYAAQAHVGQSRAPAHGKSEHHGHQRRRSETLPCKSAGPNDWGYVYTSRAKPQHGSALKDHGREDVIGGPRFEARRRRFQNRHAVDAMIAEWTKITTSLTVMQKASAKQGIPAGAVQDPMELSNVPRSTGREIFVTVRASGSR